MCEAPEDGSDSKLSGLARGPLPPRGLSRCSMSVCCWTAIIMMAEMSTSEALAGSLAGSAPPWAVRPRGGASGGYGPWPSMPDPGCCWRCCC